MIPSTLREPKNGTHLACAYFISICHTLKKGAFPGSKAGRCVRLTSLPPSCAVVMKSGNLNFLEPTGPLQACNGTDLPLHIEKVSASRNIQDNINCFKVIRSVHPLYQRTPFIISLCRHFLFCHVFCFVHESYQVCLLSLCYRVFIIISSACLIAVCIYFQKLSLVFSHSKCVFVQKFIDGLFLFIRKFNFLI